MRPAAPLLALLLLAAPAAAAGPPTDNYGDPLPDGATARVGTARLVRGWAGAVLTPDGKFLLAPNRDGPVERYDVATGRVVGTVGEKRAAPADHHYLSLSADGTRLLSLTGSAAVVQDVATGRVLTEVLIRFDWGSPTAFATAALSADGSTLAFVAAPPEAAGAGRRGQREEGDEGGEVGNEEARKRTAVVWDVGGPKRRLDVELDQDEHAGVALSADGKVLATWGWGTADTPVQFWDATAGKKLGAVTLKKVSLTSVAFAADGRAALIDRDGAVRLFDPKTGREVGKLGVRADPSGCVTFSPDGKRLAVGHFHGTVRVWDVAGDKEVSTSDGPVSTRGVAVAFVGGDRLVAWGTEGAKAVVWEVPSGKRLSPGGSGLWPRSLAFTPDGKELLTDGPGWTVRRWDPATGKPLGEWKFADGRAGPHTLRLLPGGTKVDAWSGTERFVYDPRTGKQLHALGIGHVGELSAAGDLFLNPVWTDPTRQPGLTEPVKAAVRDLATGKALPEIELPAVELKLAARTPDRTRLVTAVYLPAPSGSGESSRVAVTLWDPATGKKLGEVTGPGGLSSLGLAAGPDGKTVVLTEAAGGLRVLDLAAGKVVRKVDTGGSTPCAGPVASPDGKAFAVGVCDYGKPGDGSEVRVYDTATGKLLRAFRGHAGPVAALAFSPDGKALASASYDTTVLLWDVAAVGK